MPSGLFATDVILTDLPSTLIRSVAGSNILVALVTALPLTSMRPSEIHLSASRREQISCWERNFWIRIFVCGFDLDASWLVTDIVLDIN